MRHLFILLFGFVMIGVASADHTNTSSAIVLDLRPVQNQVAWTFELAGEESGHRGSVDWGFPPSTNSISASVGESFTYSVSVRNIHTFTATGTRVFLSVSNLVSGVVAPFDTYLELALEPNEKATFTWPSHVPLAASNEVAIVRVRILYRNQFGEIRAASFERSLSVDGVLGGRNSIDGRVVKLHHGAALVGRGDRPPVPISGIRVLLFDEQAQTLQSTQSRLDGGFQFADLPDGSYRLQFVPPPGATVEALGAMGLEPSSGLTQWIQLLDGEVLSDVDAGVIVDARDDDEDGLRDAWEAAFGLVVGADDAANSAEGDLDEDGASNLEEYLAGTNPADPGSQLFLEMFDDQNRRVLCFPSVGSHWYAIDGSASLDGPSWQNLEVHIPGTDKMIERSLGGEEEFVIYRIRAYTR